MTTDRGPKRCTVSCDGVTLSAQAKGAGMIQPGFATMLCFVQTDAVLDGPYGAEAALREAVDALLRADHRRRPDEHQRHGAAAGERRVRPAAARRACSTRCCSSSRSRSSPTARARPGSGAPASPRPRRQEEAERAARAIANSPLVKTALFGHDPNWGRVAQAAGMALAGEEVEELGLDHIDASEFAGEEAEVEVSLRLGRGDHAAHVWFSDLGYEYVRINAEYTT